MDKKTLLERLRSFELAVLDRTLDYNETLRNPEERAVVAYEASCQEVERLRSDIVDAVVGPELPPHLE